MCSTCKGTGYVADGLGCVCECPACNGSGSGDECL